MVRYVRQLAAADGLVGVMRDGRIVLMVFDWIAIEFSCRVSWFQSRPPLSCTGTIHRILRKTLVSVLSS
jgi:hypothetical protein